MTNLHTQDKQLTTASEYTLPAHISWSVVHSVISELSPFVSSKPRQWNLGPSGNSEVFLSFICCTKCNL